MTEVVDLVLSLIVGIVNSIENSPFMIVIGLTIVCSIYILILKGFKSLNERSK